MLLLLLLFVCLFACLLLNGLGLGSSASLLIKGNCKCFATLYSLLLFLFNGIKPMRTVADWYQRCQSAVLSWFRVVVVVVVVACCCYCCSAVSGKFYCFQGRNQGCSQRWARLENPPPHNKCLFHTFPPSILSFPPPLLQFPFFSSPFSLFFSLFPFLLFFHHPSLILLFPFLPKFSPSFPRVGDLHTPPTPSYATACCKHYRKLNDFGYK